MVGSGGLFSAGFGISVRMIRVAEDGERLVRNIYVICWKLSKVSSWLYSIFCQGVDTSGARVDTSGARVEVV